jgi:hypothetical protein
MQIKEITYERLFSRDMPASENERLGLVVVVEDGESASEVFERAHSLVVEQHETLHRQRKEAAEREQCRWELCLAAKQAASDAWNAGVRGDTGAMDALRCWLLETPRLSEYADLDVKGMWLTTWQEHISYLSQQIDDWDNDDDDN